MNSLVSSSPADEHFHEKERGIYSIHGYEKGDISCGDGDYTQNRSRDDGDLRGDIRSGDGRLGSRSKESSQFLSRNMEETVGGNQRCGYRSHTIHYSSHNPGDHGILFYM